MADDKEKDSTRSNPASADPTHPESAADHPVELGSEADDTDPFEPSTGRDQDGEPAFASRSETLDGGREAVDVPEELREDTDHAGAGADDQLVSVGARRKRAAEPSENVVATRGRTKKDKVTPRQTRPVEKQRRTGPAQFVRESVGELRKVVYPTGQQLVQYFVVVLIFVLFIIGIVSLLDLGFGWVIFKIFS